MYVCGYMMKSEKAVGEVLKRVSKECRSELYNNFIIATQLMKIGNTFAGNRVVGVPESAMRILSIWLIKK